MEGAEATIITTVCRHYKKNVCRTKYRLFIFPVDGDRLLFWFQFNYGNLSFTFATLRRLPVLFIGIRHILKIVTASTEKENVEKENGKET